jgi:hypothetical protein
VAVVCTDGGAATTGRLSALISWVKKEKKSVTFKSLYHPQASPGVKETEPDIT